MSCGVKAVSTTRLLSFLVQSNVANPEKLKSEILGFVGNARKKFLEPLTDFDVRVVSKALLLKKTEPDKKLSSEAIRNWNEIATGRFQFDRRQKEAEALLKLEKQDILSYWDEFILGDGNGHRVLISEVIPKSGSASSKAPLKTYQEALHFGVDDIDSYRLSQESNIYE